MPPHGAAFLLRETGNRKPPYGTCFGDSFVSALIRFCAAAGTPANTQFLVHPGKQQPMWTFTQAHIHPDDEVFCPTAIRVPKGLGVVDVDVEISMADARTMRARLHVLPS